jgi:iron complex outermembrane receptor protein
VVTTANPASTPVNPGCFFNTSESPNCSFYVNAGNARLRGVELELTANLYRGLSIDASLGYLNFKWKTLTGCSILIAGSNCTGNSGGLGANIRYGMKAPYTPEWKWSIGAQYEIDLGSLGSLTPRVDVSHQASFFQGAVNNAFNTVPANTLTNARITYRHPGGQWQASFEVTNLFDNVYYNGYWPNNSNFTVTGSPAPPRQWALTVKRTF